MDTFFFFRKILIGLKTHCRHKTTLELTGYVCEVIEVRMDVSQIENGMIYGNTDM